MELRRRVEEGKRLGQCCRRVRVQSGRTPLTRPNPLTWPRLLGDEEGCRLYTEMGATGHAEQVAAELAGPPD